MTVALVSLGPLSLTQGYYPTVPPCGNSSPQCNGTCDPGFTCTGFGRELNSSIPCECVEVGCCQFNSSTCLDNVSIIACGLNSDRFVVGGTCGVDCKPPTATPTQTPTVTITPTRTPIANGGRCVDPADCASGNCVDDVCCDTPCNGPAEACNLVGRQGTCSAIAAPAPAATRGGLVLTALVLFAIGALAVWRRRAI